MTSYDYDLFVIGAGSGGVRAARVAGAMGKKVAIAEDRYLGGTCVNVGCVPKKLMVMAAHFAEDFADASGFGWRNPGTPSFDWPAFIASKNTEIERLNGIYQKLLTNNGVTLHWGRATLKDSHTISVDGTDYTAATILIATGGWPHVPDFPGREHVITSNEAFYLDDLPKRVVIVGGGYIAVEFAGIFNGLGSAVTQLYRGPLFLRGFDGDLRAALAAEMPKKGIDLRFNADVAQIDKAADGKDGTLTLTLKDGSKIQTDLVMYATGRNPLSADLGLAGAGVELAANGAVVVDDYFKTSAPNIYALGDVIDRVALTPVAISEAMVFVANLYGATSGGAANPAQMDYHNIASAVFSQPTLGTVGLTQEEAAQRHGAVDVYVSSFTPMKHSLSGRDEKTFMKLIVHPQTDQVLGLHMMGDAAGEIVQGFAVALKCGATKADFDATVGIHPTTAEELVTMRDKK